MIKTEKEYVETTKRLDAQFKAIEQHKLKMKKAGLTRKQMHLALDPLSSFAHQLKEELEEYEQLKRGHFKDLKNLNGIGRMLVSLRIFKGMKQKDLAKKLGVKESQISRDENNEYHGASVEKIQKVLAALEVILKTEIEDIYKDAI
ncbi:MAG: helix-turn-helix transcriptional regulator [Bacteriovoracaceae bacterium]|nr:helix-turn-helix transcriptional regulator [Bacteriovoracaceae bacterium]